MMSSINRYPRDYVRECRARVDAQLASYDQLVKAARTTESNELLAAVEAFDPAFFNNMVITLDAYFVDRDKTIEGEELNPLNEVRILANSMLSNESMLTLNSPHGLWNARLKSDKTIKYVPEDSVLGYGVADEITLNRGDFVRLCEAFFDALDERFVS